MTTIHAPMCKVPQTDNPPFAAYRGPDMQMRTNEAPELFCTLPRGHRGPHRCETRSPLGNMTMVCDHMWGEQTLVCEKCGEQEFDEHPDEPRLIHSRTDDGERCGGEVRRITEAEAIKLRLAGVEKRRAKASA